MAISENKTVNIDGKPREFQKGEVLMSRAEKFGEWLQNSGLGKTIVGENYQKLKYWAFGTGLASGLVDSYLTLGVIPAVTSGLVQGAIGYAVTDFLTERKHIGNRLVPTTVTT